MEFEFLVNFVCSLCELFVEKKKPSASGFRHPRKTRIKKWNLRNKDPMDRNIFWINPGLNTIFEFTAVLHLQKFVILQNGLLRIGMSLWVKANWKDLRRSRISSGKQIFWVERGFGIQNMCSLSCKTVLGRSAFNSCVTIYKVHCFGTCFQSQYLKFNHA